MSMYIRVGDVRIDDVINFEGEDLVVVDTSYRRQQGRKMIDLVLEVPADRDDRVVRSLPVEVILTWRGTSLL